MFSDVAYEKRTRRLQWPVISTMSQEHVHQCRSELTHRSSHLHVMWYVC